MWDSNSQNHWDGIEFLWENITEVALKIRDKVFEADGKNWYKRFLEARWFDEDTIKSSSEKAQKFLGCLGVLLIERKEGKDEINSIIHHSVQNWFSNGVDINEFYGSEVGYFLISAIIRWNYDVFRKLISLKVNFLKIDAELLVWAHCPWSRYKEAEWRDAENIRVKILWDLLGLGLEITEGSVLWVIQSQDIDILKYIYENDTAKESGKRIFTQDFVKKLLAPNSKREDQRFMMTQHCVSQNPKLEHFVSSLYYKLQITEKLEASECEDIDDAAVATARDDVKARVAEHVGSPEFVAGILAEVLEEKWDALSEQVVAELKKKLKELVVARSDEIIATLVGKAS